MTINKGQAARRRVGKLPPRRSKGKNYSSSAADQDANPAASSSPSKKQPDSKTTDTSIIAAGADLQQLKEGVRYDARAMELILQGGNIEKAVAAGKVTRTILPDGTCIMEYNGSDAEQQSQGEAGDGSESEGGVEKEEEGYELEQAVKPEDEASDSAAGDEDDDDAGEDQEEENASTTGYGSSPSGSGVSSLSRRSDVSSSSSSSERTSPRDLKGCRAEIKRIEAREALGLNLDDYEDRCLLENANLTREEIADVKDRAHRYNVRFTEATRAEDGEGWLEGTILRMHGVVRHFERRAEGQGRRMTHAERHIVKMARMAMVDSQHVQAKERKREERERGGG